MCCGNKRGQITTRQKPVRPARAPRIEDGSMPFTRQASQGVFELWTSHGRATLNFIKFAEKFTLSPPYVMSNYELGYGWGLYDATTDRYYKLNSDVLLNLNVTIETCSFVPLEMDPRIFNSRPNGVILFSNAKLEVTGGESNEEFRIYLES